MGLSNGSSLVAIAAKNNFNRNNFEKAWRLLDVLEFVDSDPFLRDRLALKGGTAINLTIFDNPRLSGDLDFDFSENCDPADLLSTRNNVLAVINPFMISKGYEPEEAFRRSHSLDSVHYYYSNIGGGKDLIKLDINYSDRCHILPLERRKCKVNWDERGLEVLSVHTIEIFATKISALLTRSAARDLYDVVNLKKSGIFDSSDLELLNRCVAFYMALSGDFHGGNYHYGNMDKLTQADIRKFIVPMIRGNEFFELAEGKKQAREYLDSFLKITPEVRAFFDAFLSGKYKPELLFPEDGIGKKLLAHPMALWRIKEYQRR